MTPDGRIEESDLIALESYLRKYTSASMDLAVGQTLARLVTIARESGQVAPIPLPLSTVEFRTLRRLKRAKRRAAQRAAGELRLALLAGAETARVVTIAAGANVV